ncbi:NAD(P)-binding protein [Annulohypoxylon maeteangense]|uniref:NAD(P)-binding protein n=1 Tax=Annulohypoxylon maeteangense TaxID=1927788 RepID=UPI00200879C4|nr:NAD(P)-binding protein [Annulohypoxylon maeteangense]KAI0884945.1 NAD(P)-binding protein [Annulohypoxylon maeteangense]
MSPNNHIKKVAIVGATGTVGKFIVEELLKLGKHEVTAISRKDSPSASSIPAGVKVAAVDYSDESTLVNALKGQEVLIITMSTLAPPDTQLQLIRAAAAANVPYVLPNEWGCDMADEQLGKEILLGNSEVPARKLVEELGKSSWIGVVSGFWYEYSLGMGEQCYGMEVKDKTWTFYDDGETKINSSTWPQSGRAVAKLLSLPIEPETTGGPSLSSYKNKFIYVSSFLVSQKDMFASVLRVTGTKESDWTIKYEDSTKRYQEAQKKVFGGDRTAFPTLLYSRIFYKDGVGNFEARRGGIANDTLGLPKEDLDEATKIGIYRNENGLKYH